MTIMTKLNAIKLMCGTLFTVGTQKPVLTSSACGFYNFPAVTTGA